jgi:ACT domain-containing protein
MNKIVITVFGKDRTGIVAGISNAISSMGVNIEDLTSTRMEDLFVMLVVCDVSKSKVKFNDIKKKLTDTGKKIGVNVVVQSEEIFKMMHRI